MSRLKNGIVIISMRKRFFSSLVKADRDARLLPRLTLYFFKRPKLTAVAWLSLLVFGILSYTTLMPKQGFPPVQAPLAVVTGTYLVEDAKKVDQQVTAPLSEIALQLDFVKTVSAEANASTFNLLVQYEENAGPEASTRKLEQAVKDSGRLPKDAAVTFQTIDVSKFSPTGEGFDILIAVYGKDHPSTAALVAKAQAYSDKLNAQKLDLVASTKVLNPLSEGVNPATGQVQQIQTGFDRYGERVGGKTVFYDDVVIGLKAKPGADTVKLYEQVKTALDGLNKDRELQGYKATITAAFAPDILQEINELQRTLLEGLIAVLIIGTVLVTLRASLLIIVSMATVIAITLGVIYAIGYTLNVITLFAIILGLALIVDDTIIMTEALDVERRRKRNALDTVKTASKKVSLAMLAATSTAILGFAPIIFISGILGGFIRPIPITIIISLVVSLLVALTVIPFLARFLILRKGYIGPQARVSRPVRLQEDLAHKLTASLRWANHSAKRLWISGVVALIVGFSLVFAGAYMFKYLPFNIFPSGKDTNQLQITMRFPDGTDIKTAEAIAAQADKVVADTLDENFHRLSYSYMSMAGPNQATASIHLVPYSQRGATAPQLVDKLKNSFKDFKQANVSVGEQGVGGPPGVFNVLVQTTDRANASALARDMAAYLEGKALTRPDGSQAHIVRVVVSSPETYLRKDNKQLVQVSASFDATDTSTLVTLAKELVQKKYTNQELARYQLTTANLVFDFGFEGENQESFKSIVIAFPILLVAMYLLLAYQFRSLMQPLLIFLAIPFSFLGVTGGLWLTDNPFSFFTALGFFALIGLSIKNTILLTDYANQARRAGLGRVDAIIDAVEERFRPLLATSATAVFSLLPLALTSPFWESLAYTLIFGLLSSTLLVLLVFPYYYLGGEYLRLKVRRRSLFLWLGLNIAGAVVGRVPGVLGVNAGFIIWKVYDSKFKKTSAK